jgi:hypothetical protein
MLIAGAAGGCSQPVQPAGPASASAVIESSHVDPNTGNLIALWMPMRGPKGGQVLQPVLVSHPYEVYINWPSEENEPNSAAKRFYIFHDNVGKKSYQTKDYDAFLAVVARQPRGISLIQIETCSVPRCYMPTDQWGRLEKVMAAGGRKWGSEDCTSRFCYCEAVGEFVFPGDRK